MKSRLSRPLPLAAVLIASLLSPVALLAGESDVYRSELFTSLKPVYEDRFDGALNTAFWEVRQGTTWTIQDGILTGNPSTKEFQEKMLAKGDKAHAGFKPVIWLKQVPERFVFTARLRHRAGAFMPRFPLIDLGHHVHTLSFSEKATTVTIRQNVQTLTVAEPLLTLNQWHDLAIELKPGQLLLKIDDKKHLFESPHIDMAGQAQIDFKGIDLGTWEIDSVRLWEGQ
ncbi:MAG: hypothetical protein JNK37_04550 [Verrucomicrobiales bacterium]|nr:hypothetical protein [Verrucomicrobiales bacterium]